MAPGGSGRLLVGPVDTACLFKARIDKLWMHQVVKYDFTADLTGIGDRSVHNIMMTMMMMSGFVERVINSPQTRCQSAKQLGLQMSSERQRGESCSLQSSW